MQGRFVAEPGAKLENAMVYCAWASATAGASRAGATAAAAIVKNRQASIDRRLEFHHDVFDDPGRYRPEIFIS